MSRTSRRTSASSISVKESSGSRKDVGRAVSMLVVWKPTVTCRQIGREWPYGGGTESDGDRQGREGGHRNRWRREERSVTLRVYVTALSQASIIHRWTDVYNYS